MDEEVGWRGGNKKLAPLTRFAPHGVARGILYYINPPPCSSSDKSSSKEEVQVTESTPV